MVLLSTFQSPFITLQTPTGSGLKVYLDKATPNEAA